MAVYDLQGYRQIQSLRSYPKRSLSLSFSPDSRYLAVAPSNDKELEVCDLSQKRSQRYPLQQPARFLAFVHNSNILALDTAVDKIVFYNLAHQRELTHLEIVDTKLASLCLTLDGRAIVGFEKDNHRIQIINRDPISRKEFWIPHIFIDSAGTVQTNSVICAAISHDQTIVAAASLDGVIRLFDLKTLKEQAPLLVEKPVFAMCFPPTDKDIYVFDQAGKVLQYPYISGSSSPNRPIRLEPDKDWTNLLVNETSKTYESFLAFVNNPDMATAFLAKKLKPAPIVDQKSLDTILENISSGYDPQTRIAGIEDVLVASLARRVSDMTANRLFAREHELQASNRLVNAIKIIRATNGFQERMRSVRAVQILEHIGSPQAIKIIKRLADGNPASEVTMRAKVALENSGAS